MGFVENYEELEVYRLARKLSGTIFELTLHFPDEETYSIIDQIRRSSRSVGAQIAEAWGHRRYQNAFVSKLTDAGGEINETIHWIETAEDCEYISSDKTIRLKDDYKKLNKMIHSMINKAEKFCSRENDD